MGRRFLVVVAAIAVIIVAISVYVSARERSEYEYWQPSKIEWGRTIKLDTSAPGYWWVNLRTKVGHIPGGLAGAEQVVGWYPASAPAHYNLAVYLYASDPVRSKHELRCAIELDKRYDPAKKLLEQLEQDLADGRVFAPPK